MTTLDCSQKNVMISLIPGVYLVRIVTKILNLIEFHLFDSSGDASYVQGLGAGE